MWADATWITTQLCDKPELGKAKHGTVFVIIIREAMSSVIQEPDAAWYQSSRSISAMAGPFAITSADTGEFFDVTPRSYRGYLTRRMNRQPTGRHPPRREGMDRHPALKTTVCKASR
ncbi:hypothetical protein ACTZWT_04765 [Rhodopseudomonas sp. NSM]|uniref:hypothetical protein n=1 Tax=Rhodopseudomonas sp. NSM TaxID=3457630 RepID=UPI0040368497